MGNTGRIKNHKRGKGHSSIAREPLQDSRLSWKARGIYAYLRSLPEDWIIYKSEIQTHSQKDQRDGFNTGFNELKALGYITQEKIQNESGLFEYVYNVYEEPHLEQIKPHTDYPSTDEPTTEQPTTVKPTLQSNTIVLPKKIKKVIKKEDSLSKNFLRFRETNYYIYAYSGVMPDHTADKHIFVSHSVLEIAIVTRQEFVHYMNEVAAIRFQSFDMKNANRNQFFDDFFNEFAGKAFSSIDHLFNALLKFLKTPPASSPPWLQKPASKETPLSEYDFVTIPD